MRYRGFELTATPTRGTERVQTQASGKELCKGFFCEVYDPRDMDQVNMLDFFSLAEGYDIPGSSLESLDTGMRRYVDEHFAELVAARLDVDRERKDLLIGRFITWLGEYERGADLYSTLSEQIGMDDDEIRAAGFTSFVPYFDQELYAQIIAEHIIDLGTENTTTGRWEIGFSYLNDRYGVDLPNDQHLMDLIGSHLGSHSDLVEGYACDEVQYNVRFRIACCPYVDEEEETNNLITAEDLVEQAVYAAHAPDCRSASDRSGNMLQMLGANVVDESVYHDEDEHPGIVPAM